MVIVSFGNKTNKINIACHTYQPTNWNIVGQGKENSILKIILKGDIPSCANQRQHFWGKHTIPGPDTMEAELTRMERVQMICLETVSAQYHLHNLEDIFRNISFFSGERRGGPHFFFSLLGGPVVPSLEQKGYNFFFLLAEILSAGSCSASIVCCILSTASLQQGPFIIFFLRVVPCFPPLFPSSLQVSSFSFYWDVSLKKKKVV